VIAALAGKVFFMEWNEGKIAPRAMEFLESVLVYFREQGGSRGEILVSAHPCFEKQSGIKLEKST
jgi:hypothetical protein